MKYDYGLNFNENDSLYKITQRIKPNSTVLEFGPAAGRLTSFLSNEYNCKVYIVEIDQEGFDKAIKFAENGLCANIEDIDISTLFADIAFDFIIFADVLEHLRNPQKVLSDINNTFPNAKVLCSVPNIAHNAIIINLLNNEFQYNNLGLLDNTHIHFFTYNSFCKMAEESNYLISYEDCTVAEVGKLEIINSYSDVDDGIVSSLKQRDFSNAYQYIFELNSTKLKEQTIKESRLKIKGNNYISQIYYGEEFSEADSIVKSISGFEKEISFDVSNTTLDNYKYLRIDLINTNAVIKDISIIINGQRVKFKDNSDAYCKNTYLFSKEPELIVDLSLYKICFPLKATVSYSIKAFDIVSFELNNILKAFYFDSSNYDQNENSFSSVLNSIKEYEEKNAKLNNALCVAINNYNAVINSRYWRIGKPLRKIISLFKKVLYSNKITRNTCKGLLSIKRVGIKTTFKKAKRKILNQNNSSDFKLSRKELNKQRKTVFKNPVKFSVLVPLYNTPEKFLREMIQSVIDQTYSNWELCLADGSDINFGSVETICKEYQTKDSRIKYKKLGKNLGISENTNECIRMSTGDYITLFDHDDLLHQSALFENAKAINNCRADFIYTDEASFVGTKNNITLKHFKSDFAIDTLRSYNYICHLTTFKKTLIDEVGMFRSICDGSQDYDIILRLTEKAEKIVHIPKILYYWRVHKNSVACDISAKMYTLDAAKKALSDHLERVGLKGEVTDGRILSTYKINYDIINNPLVSILIPNKDCINDLKNCIYSILEKSTYSNYEIIIIENNSTEEETFRYYKKLEEKHSNIKVVYWDGIFNYSSINNFGEKYAKGEYLILLNNDVEIITESWIEEMLMFSQRKDVGAVGVMLYYPDDTVQHGGVILGIGGVAGHAHKYFNRDDPGYMSKLSIVQNMSCVTAACMMIPRAIFEEINGFDETFKVAFNDVDLCMRIREKGYNIIWTPFAELYHYESKSRGYEDTPEKVKRFNDETSNFLGKWGEIIEKGDPYYNPNLTLEHEDYSFK